jgi:hypothetical protein
MLVARSRHFLIIDQRNHEKNTLSRKLFLHYTLPWTKWRKIADKKEWYDDDFDNDGPAYYELGVGHSKTRVSIKYVGHTINERRRMSEYGAHGSHISAIVPNIRQRKWRQSSLTIMNMSGTSSKTQIHSSNSLEKHSGDPARLII